MHRRILLEARLLACLVMTIAATVSCRRESHVSDGFTSAMHAASPSVSMPVAQDSLGRLIASLRGIRGEFRQTPPYGSWEFQGDQRVFVAISQFADSAVRRLVQCLGDTTTSSVLVSGRPALLGAVCYEALRHVAYVEKPADDQPWVGDISPNAVPEDLWRGKAAWVEAVRTHMYTLL